MSNENCQHLWNVHGQCQWCKRMAVDVEFDRRFFRIKELEAEIERLTAENERLKAESQPPCSNGFCWLRIGPCVGQHTNGPCNCLRDVPLPLQQAIKRKITHQQQEIARMQAEVEKSTAAYMDAASSAIDLHAKEERLTAELAAANQLAAEARQESIVAAQEAYEAVDDAMKAAKASHNDLRITMPEIAKMNVLRWPWLEEKT